MIISFSGVDCAGKSTQIEALNQYLTSLGLRAKVMWYRPGYSPELEALKRAYCTLFKVERAKKRIKSSQECKKFTFKQAVWITTALLDMTTQWAAKLRLWERKSDVIICDRYIDDAMCDFMFRFPNFPYFKELFRCLRPLFPKPDLAFLMMIPHDVMLARMAEKQEPFPDPPEIRDRRYEIYKTWAQTPSYTCIDTTQPREIVFEGILRAYELKA